MTINLSAFQQQRRDTAANWTSQNPTLKAGEIGYETDTGYIKVGDGSTAWTSLAYIHGTKVSAYPLATVDIANDAITGDKLANDITIANDLTVTNNLTVNGTTTTIDTQNLVVEDHNIVIGSVATPSDTTADGGGITLKGATDKTINWVQSTGCWTFNQPTNFNNHVRIDSSGNVGVGTASPGRQVHISDASTAELHFTNDAIGNTSSDGSTIYVANTGELGIRNRENSFTTFYTNNTERLRIDSSGNVGIGLTPTSKLHVHGTANRTPVAFRGSGTGTGHLYADDSSFGIVTSAGSFSGTDAFVGVDSGNFCYFVTSGSERMRIDSAGKVGIGTSTPTLSYGTGLHIAGGNAGLKLQNTTNGDWAFIEYADESNAIKYIQGYRDSTGVYGIRPGNSLSSASGISIDSSGKLLVGTISDYAENVQAAFYGASNGGIALASGTSGLSRLMFADATAGNAGAYVGSIIYSHADDSLRFNVNGGTERMRIDSSGNVQVSTGQFTVGTHGTTGLQLINDGTFGTIQSADLKIRTAAAERMRIDTSGRLLVNTSVSRIVEDHAGNGPEALIQIEGQHSAGIQSIIAASTIDASRCGTLSLGRHRNNTVGGTPTVVQSGDSLGAICFAGGDGTDMRSKGAFILCQVDGTPGSNDMPGRLMFSTTADGASSPTERMRIDKNGLGELTSADHCFDAGVTAGAGTSTRIFTGRHSATAGSTGSGTISFRVFSNGNVQNTNNSYGAISDAKLKENIVDASSQWDDIKDLRVRNYNFIEGQTHTQIGVVAQEVEIVSPGLVSESPDRDEEGNDLGTTTKSVNYSVLYMKAVKALQEAMDRIETLEAKVAALEAE
tara:strand:- start:414 stop:2942 length:2529 start_codon:yes stop_codon:yes gene_type:complete